jgi:hypothetical protein
MSFEIFLNGDDAQTDRLPTKADVETIFAGFILRDSLQFHRLEVGLSDADSCGIHYGEEALQTSLTVDRPVDSDWLWERIFRLLQDFDLFMIWPTDDLKAVVARADVPLYADMPAQKVTVRTAHELRDAIA